MKFFITLFKKIASFFTRTTVKIALTKVKAVAYSAKAFIAIKISKPVHWVMLLGKSVLTKLANAKDYLLGKVKAVFNKIKSYFVEPEPLIQVAI